MAQGFQLEEIDATFGAVVTDFDLDSADAQTWDELYKAWLHYALLVFPGIHLSPEQHVELARRFGPLEGERFPITNIKKDGSLLRLPEDQARFDMILGNYDWHSDTTYRDVQGKATVFTAEIVPPSGGETGWADMRAAYDSLDDAMRAKVDGLTAHHSIRHSQANRGYQIVDDEDFSPDAWPGPVRPLVKEHPETGRKSLLIGRHAHSTSGMSDNESRALLDELEAFACQPPRVYFHAWQAGDAVLWDNRCLLHCGKPWEVATYPRKMWHMPIAGDPGTEGALKTESREPERVGQH